ncbi:hypothetical protein [Halarchaeum sp. P4]|uniref:hypothetical protein n=1 Tax=Halarchaeum sp. P4 TaxID=3421639 RepID=UPI003EBCAABC
MSDGKPVERCGRCAASTVVDAADVDADPYAGDCIEVDEAEARAVSAHVVAVGAVKSWLDDLGRWLTYGR